MCTGVRLIAHDGSVAYGRTLEFAQELQSNILVIPRNYTIAGIGTDTKKSGLSWQARYAAVGANACNEIALVDGINEHGLAGGLFYFPGYAHFQETQDLSNAIAPWQLLTWILTQCTSIEHVQQQLPTITVINIPFPAWGIVPPVHAIVHDITGKSLVIEYQHATLFMHDNPLGVLTNAPDFQWHMTNVRNYLNLSAYNVAPQKIGNIELRPFGQGSGMVGLPGDFTPPSRFIRAALFTNTVITPKNANDAVHTVFHILDLFNIPRGIIREKENNTVLCDYTQWTSACDLKNRRYYYHTYNNRSPIMIDLMQTDIDTKEPSLMKMK